MPAKFPDKKGNGLHLELSGYSSLLLRGQVPLAFDVGSTAGRRVLYQTAVRLLFVKRAAVNTPRPRTFAEPNDPVMATSLACHVTFSSASAAFAETIQSRTSPVLLWNFSSQHSWTRLRT